MSEEVVAPIMGNDEWMLYKELYEVVERAQKRGVSVQVAIGHVHGLQLHLEYLLLGQIRRDQMPTREDTPIVEKAEK